MKKTFMLVSALAMVAMSIAVTSCKKDKDDEPSSCTCTDKFGNKEVITGTELKEGFDYYGVSNCSELGKAISADWKEDISCK